MNQGHSLGYRLSTLITITSLLFAALFIELPKSAEATTISSQPLEFGYHVVNYTSHDDSAFTQGLLFHDGFLYESTGLYGSSTLRKIDPNNGSVVLSANLSEELFGEGLTYHNGKLIQLTWKAEVALIYDVETLALIGNYTYSGEGWGLCTMYDTHVMSNGTNQLTLRNSSTFEVFEVLEVTHDGEPLAYLNELECYSGVIWANVYGSNSIFGINPVTGETLFFVDLSALVPDDAASGSVLNGIAINPDAQSESESPHLLVGGKRWDTFYEISLYSSYTSPPASNQPEAGSLTAIISIALIAAAGVLVLWLKIPVMLPTRRGVDNPSRVTMSTEAEE